MSSHLPIVPFVFFATGLAAAGFGARQYYRQELADPYDGVTRGEVRSSELNPRAARDRTDYTPSVRYEYEVDGVTYENDVVRSAEGPLSRRGARVLLGAYEEGSAVSVHYDPDAPDRSVLVPPESGRVWLLLVVAGLVAAGLSAFLAL